MSEFGTIDIPARFQAAINHASNYGPKAVTEIGLYTNGTSTTSDIDRVVSDKTYIEGRYSHYLPYLADAGFATAASGPSKHSNRIVRYFTACRENDVLPPLGAVLPWGQRFALPLTLLLSYTNAADGSKQRGPMNSLHILAAVMDGGPINMREQRKPDSTFSINRIEEMLKDEVIKPDEDVNSFKINDPTYRGTTPIERVKPEVAAVYKALADAKNLRPYDSWSVEEILYLAKIRQSGVVNPSWETQVRKNIRRAAYSTQSRSFHRAIYKKPYVHGAYQINPLYAEAVNALLEAVVHLGEANSDQQKKLASIAIELYDQDATAIHDIVARDFDFNPNNGYVLEAA
jgi:hypothetical protein